MVNTLFQLFANVAAENLKFTLEPPKPEAEEQVAVDFNFKGLLFDLVDNLPDVPDSTKFLIKTFITDSVVNELESAVKSFVGNALEVMQNNLNK